MTDHARALATLRAFCAKLDARRDAGVRRGAPGALNLTRAKFAGSDETSVIAGYASVFSVVDLQKEVVEPGAFAASLAQHRRDGTAPLMLWQHNPAEPIGVWASLVEDAKGLRVEGRLLTGVRRADEALALIRAGALAGLSIGYRVVRDRLDAKTGVRHLLELDLLEISIVSFPANREAGIGKAADLGQAGATIAAFLKKLEAEDERRRAAEIRAAVRDVISAAGRWR